MTGQQQMYKKWSAAEIISFAIATLNLTDFTVKNVKKLWHIIFKRGL